MKNRFIFSALALLSLPLAAQVSFTGNYSQNFDSLGTGTNLASLTGWSHLGTLGGGQCHLDGDNPRFRHYLRRYRRHG